LAHESGEKEMVDAEKAFITMDKNDLNHEHDEAVIDWETDNESNDIDREYVSDDESE
jgi:hypothetical protein